MKRPYEEPKTADDGVGGDGATRTTHPAYGQISASRVSGATNLYGSDFTHQHYVSITIQSSELCRDLNRDRYHPTKRLVQVSMSLAQWATFISSMNVAAGSPCTIEYIIGEGATPAIPIPKTRTEQFGAELAKRFEKARVGLDHLRQVVSDAKAAQGLKATLMSLINRVEMDISTNVKFTADQFDEHMEHTVESAKVEVNAYAEHVMNRIGADNLKLSEDSTTSPLFIDVEDK